MTNKVLFITDTFKDLNIKKDTSILMMEEAISLGFNVFQCEINDLYIKVRVRSTGSFLIAKLKKTNDKEAPIILDEPAKTEP